MAILCTLHILFFLQNAFIYLLFLVCFLDILVLKHAFLLQGNSPMAILSRKVDEDKHMLSSDVLHNLEASYAEAFKEIFSLAVGVVGKLTDQGISTDGTHDSLEGNITLWKDILQTYVMNLQMGHLFDASKKLTVSVVCPFTFSASSFHLYRIRYICYIT